MNQVIEIAEAVEKAMGDMAENWTPPACPYQFIEDSIHPLIDPSSEEVTVSKAENCVTIHFLEADVNFIDIPFPDKLLEAMISS